MSYGLAGPDLSLNLFFLSVLTHFQYIVLKISGSYSDLLRFTNYWQTSQKLLDNLRYKMVEGKLFKRTSCAEDWMNSNYWFIYNNSSGYLAACDCTVIAVHSISNILLSYLTRSVRSDNTSSNQFGRIFVIVISVFNLQYHHMHNMHLGFCMFRFKLAKYWVNWSFRMTTARAPCSIQESGITLVNETCHIRPLCGQLCIAG